jgi:transcriptional regulator with XRE-family HTH domain
MSTHERLREERERLGLSQTEFGQIGGVKKVAQINYEKGVRQPDAAYLAAIAAAGVDVLYVLTGQRSAAPTSPPPPPTREDFARGTALDPAWPMVLELVYDQLIAHKRRLPNGKALRELVDAVVVVLRLEEGEPSNEKIRRKIEAIL